MVVTTDYSLYLDSEMLDYINKLSDRTNVREQAMAHILQFCNTSSLADVLSISIRKDYQFAIRVLAKIDQVVYNAWSVLISTSDFVDFVGTFK